MTKDEFMQTIIEPDLDDYAHARREAKKQGLHLPKPAEVEKYQNAVAQAAQALYAASGSEPVVALVALLSLLRPMLEIALLPEDANDVDVARVSGRLHEVLRHHTDTTGEMLKSALFRASFQMNHGGRLQ